MDTLTLLRKGHLIGSTRLDLACDLTEFPQEIFDLADTLEILNLSGNQLRSLPDDFGRLSKLRILFCSDNPFEHLPPSLGDCPQLSMIGFKSNQIATVPAESLPPNLRWLILTDNRLPSLPDAIGQRPQLQKLMLSGNRLAELPESLAQCSKLELLRIASNQLPTLPQWLLDMPRLAWLAFAGNPLSIPCAPTTLPAEIPWQELHLQRQLGEGASGTIHQALWQKAHPVAVKLFKGTMTSDGLPASEMAAAIAAGHHPHLNSVLGRVVHHPTQMEGLAMALIDPSYQTLAGPPSFTSCTRDVFAPELKLSPATALAIAHGVASAAQHLHACHIHHGDLYAHNILWRADGHCYLNDFGAAAFYPSKHAKPLQRLEARAFGCVLEELYDHTDWPPDTQPAQSEIIRLRDHCLSLEPKARPLFSELVETLKRLLLLPMLVTLAGLATAETSYAQRVNQTRVCAEIEMLNPRNARTCDPTFLS